MFNSRIPSIKRINTDSQKQATNRLTMKIKRLDRNPFSKLPIFGKSEKADTESVISEGNLTNKENDLKHSNAYVKEKIIRYYLYFKHLVFFYFNYV